MVRDPLFLSDQKRFSPDLVMIRGRFHLCNFAFELRRLGVRAFLDVLF